MPEPLTFRFRPERDRFSRFFDERFSFGEDPLVALRTPQLPYGVAWSLFLDNGKSLKALVAASEEVQAAIMLASPSLYGEMRKWLDDGVTEEKLILRILAYVLRMSTRPTPFGLFAAVSIVKMGDSTNLAIESRLNRRCRPDMAWFQNLLKEVQGSIRDEIEVVANDLITQVGSRCKILNSNLLVQQKLTDNVLVFNYAPVSISMTDAVSYLRELCGRPRPFGKVVEQLAAHFDETEDEARRLAEELWNAGFFMDELTLSPIGDPCERLSSVLQETNHPIASQWADWQAQKKICDAGKATPTKLEALQEGQRKLIDQEPALQVDATRAVHGTLGTALLEDVKRLCSIMLQAKPFSLAEYRERFLSRYEGSSLRVPLLELIDPARGIGTPASPEGMGLAIDEDRAMEVVASSVREGRFEVALDELALSKLLFAPPKGAFCESFEVGFELLASSRGAIESGDYVLVPAGMPASAGAGRSLGRFADMLDPEAIERLNTLEQDLARDGSTRAELVVSPPLARTLNVSIRPRFNPTEVQVGLFDDTCENRISPSELLVGLDNGRFSVFSGSTGKRLTITESHLLNVPGACPSVARTLSMIAKDGETFPLPFSWGSAAGKLPFVPRARYGRIILSKARWRFSKETLEAALVSGIAAFRAKWLIPERVAILDADNKLALDLSSNLGQSLFKEQIARAHGSVVIEEILPDENQCWIQDESGLKYRGEFVVSVKRRRPSTKLESSLNRIPKSVTRRDRLAGPASKWSFYKLYCDPDDAERFLTEVVSPHLNGREPRPKWFFIRYGDERFHLRLRVKEQPDAQLTPLAEVVEQCLMDGRLSRVTIDTYEREVERYGGNEGLTLCEELFALSSNDVLDHLNSWKSDELARRYFCADRCLRLYEAFETAADHNFGIGDLYFERASMSRDEREMARRLASDVMSGERRQFGYVKQAGELISELVSLSNAGKLQRDLANIFNDLIHLQCNRSGIFVTEEPSMRRIVRQIVHSLDQRSGSRERALSVV